MICDKNYLIGCRMDHLSHQEALMNRREAVLRALRFEEVRPVPYTVWYEHEVAARLARHYGDPEWDSRIRNYIHRINIEWEPKVYVEPDTFRDIHGTFWREGKPPHILTPALNAPSLKGFRIPDYVPYLKNPEPSRVGVMDGIVSTMTFDQADRLVHREKDEVFTVVTYGAGSILERGWMIRGFENFFTDLILEPRFVEELLDLILERQLELVAELLRLECDAVLTADDWGDQRGIIIGPDLWRRFIKPRMKILIEKIHAGGKLIFHHTCGNVFDIVPDLIEIGLDCLQSLQPEALPVYKLKQRYGRDLSLWGGLGTQQLLPFGTPEEIRMEVRKLKQELGKGGGYIFSSSKPIMQEVPTENAAALVEESIREETGGTSQAPA